MIGQHFNSCSCPEKTQVKSANNSSVTPPQTHSHKHTCSARCCAKHCWCNVGGWRGGVWPAFIRETWCDLCEGLQGMRARPTLYTVPGSRALYPQASWPQRLALDLCLSPLFPCGRIPLALSHSLHAKVYLKGRQRALHMTVPPTQWTLTVQVI